MAKTKNDMLKCNYPECMGACEDAPRCEECKIYKFNTEIDIRWSPPYSKIYEDQFLRGMRADGAICSCTEYLIDNKVRVPDCDACLRNSLRLFTTTTPMMWHSPVCKGTIVAAPNLTDQQRKTVEITAEKARETFVLVNKVISMLHSALAFNPPSYANNPSRYTGNAGGYDRGGYGYTGGFPQYNKTSQTPCMPPYMANGPVPQPVPDRPKEKCTDDSKCKCTCKEEGTATLEIDISRKTLIDCLLAIENGEKATLGACK